jgi:hypothetical protein
MAKTKTEAARAKLNMTMAEEFDHFLAIDIELQSQIGRLRKKVGTNMANWEAVGGDADDIREARRLDKEGLERLKRVTRVAGYMGLVAVDSKGQWGFHAALAPDADLPPTTQTKEGQAALARADSDGWNSGWAGGSADDNPHPAGTQISAIWARACRDGAEAREADKAVRAKPKPVNAAAEEAPQTESLPSGRKKGKGGRGKTAQAAPEPPEAEIDATEEDAGGLLDSFQPPALPH